MFGKAVKALGLFVVLLVVMIGTALGVAALFNGRIGVSTDLRRSLLLATPAAPLAEDVVLKVVTFNIQDLWVVGRNREARMEAIGKTLRNLDPDIVGMQESFIDSDRELLLASLAESRLAYHQYYPSGTMGCGLLVLSAYPIVESFFHRYAQNGKWYKPYHGDWWAGKGVALARIKLPQGILDFYDTHAHAQYKTSEYDDVRKFQMGDLATFVRASATGNAPALVVGDLNCKPGTIQYDTLVSQAKLDRLMNLTTSIDHIFGVEDEKYTYEVLETVPIEGKVKSSWGFTGLSDHKGYMSTIRVRPTEAAKAHAQVAAATVQKLKPAMAAGELKPEPVFP